ncbi:MAG: hypothetical protein HGA67_03865 [Candidatus Yonathbacteria bacterium]|nr:hypothetical protein [Candidatus Yonathbacteria bacterium]
MMHISFLSTWNRCIGSIGAFLLVAALPTVVSAQGIVPCDGLDCDFNSLIGLVQALLTFFLTTAPFVAAALFAYGGFLYFTARGDTGQIGKAHKVFGAAAFGLVLILAAWLVIYTIMTGLGVTDDAYWFLAH